MHIEEFLVGGIDIQPRHNNGGRMLMRAFVNVIVIYMYLDLVECHT